MVLLMCVWNKKSDRTPSPRSAAAAAAASQRRKGGVPVPRSLSFSHTHTYHARAHPPLPPKMSATKLSPSGGGGDLSGSYSDIGSSAMHNSKHSNKHESLDDDEDDASSLASLLHDDDDDDDEDVVLSRLEMMQDPLDAKLDPQNWSLRRKVWVAVGVAFYTYVSVVFLFFSLLIDFGGFGLVWGEVEEGISDWVGEEVEEGRERLEVGILC
jgi:hypothetical protein